MSANEHEPTTPTTDHTGASSPAPDHPPRDPSGGPPVNRSTERSGGQPSTRRGPDAAPVFPEARLEVVAWADPVLDQLGHDPRSAYVERFWLPILGPSCLLLLRRLAAELERQPDGYPIDPAIWARELGVGMKGGRHGPFWRAIERSCRFGAARRNGPRLAVRRRLPPLSSRQIERLPDPLRTAHDAWAEARLAQPRRQTVTRWPGERQRSVDPPFPDAA